MHATYSPEDNKLRLYAGGRLDSETYARVKAAGFIWAPKQQLFVAPAWSPNREDLLIDLCGEIGDEDTSLVDRAEDRAERFEDYSEKRLGDAQRARDAVSAIADNIPLGQPILVGHHSERHARKDAERIQNSMRKAVKMWETSQYWEQRAAGALRHAKYKELSAVRARRIKGLEADKRRLIADYTPRDKFVIMQSRWNARGEDAPKVPHVFCGQARGGHWVAVEDLEKIKARSVRWLNHIENRLTYERAMLAEAGGLADERFNIELGGKVLVRGEWVVVLKINKSGGKISSLTTNRHYVSKVGIEDVKDYQPPEEGTAEKVKKVMALPPLCNYPGVGFCHMTKAEYASVYTDSKGGRLVRESESAAAHRVRSVMNHIARRFDKSGNVSVAREQWGMSYVYLTDEKRKDPPKPETIKAEPVKIDAPEPVLDSRPVYVAPEPTEFDAMKDSLKAGVKVVSAPQLFPTPPDIAAKMVDLAELESGLCVLEPSAGTGNLVQAVLDAVDTEVLAYEINQTLVSELGRKFPSYKCQARRADFLEVTDFQGSYPRIIMNPPFQNGEDIKHIRHAQKFLAPGGRLVALCANGPRQRDTFMDEAEYWEDLPAGSFKEQGTGVNVAMMVLVGPESCRTETREVVQASLF